MNDIQVFSNPEFGAVRSVEIDGLPWFVGRDVAGALGYSNTRDALSRHVDDEDKNTVVNPDGTPGNPNMVIINESGLYSLILSSKLPTAKRFKRWITSEVLPTLRRTGRFELPEIEAAIPVVCGELTPGDYIRAASIISTCKAARLQSVITLLERSGLDVSGLSCLPVRSCDRSEDVIPDTVYTEIRDFAARQVPSDWAAWSIQDRRRFWAGEAEAEKVVLVDRDRITAAEVWCELYGGNLRDVSGHIRRINSVLSVMPGWKQQTVRAGSEYGLRHGFVKVSPLVPNHL